MSEGQQDQDKQYEASQKKLDEARKKGEIAKSTDLITAAGYGGFLIACWGAGASSFLALGETLSGLLGQSARIADDIFAARSAPFIGQLLGELAPSLMFWAVLPGVLAMLAVVAQRALIFAPSKLEPKLSRISLIKGIGNKFGRNGIFEFFKSFAKLLIYSGVLGLFLWAQSQRILGTIYLSPAQATIELLTLGLIMFSIVLLVAFALGGVDFLWQTAEHARKNRMSRKEMTDEHKEAEGDPMMKQRRREKGISLAMNQMLADVPEADVVIVNPTHYAVALKWDRAARRAPVCVAKGTDVIAMRIREIATEAGVPLHSDPPTARALHATLEVGDEIVSDHYKAVAAAIRFADRVRGKARG